MLRKKYLLCINNRGMEDELVIGKLYTLKDEGYNLVQVSPSRLERMFFKWRFLEVNEDIINTKLFKMVTHDE